MAQGFLRRDSIGPQRDAVVEARKLRPLPQIDGAPPDLTVRPVGCSFHPRCPQQIARCVEHEPALEPRGENLAACWVPRDRWVS